MKEEHERPDQERPPNLTPEIREELIDRIRDGETFKSICADRRMPTRRRLRELLSDKRDPELWVAAYFAVAGRCNEWVEDTLAIADGAERRRESVSIDGEKSSRRGGITRDRLRIEARQWLLQGFQPERFGRRPRRSGTDTEPLPILVPQDFSNMPDEEIIPKVHPRESMKSRR
jgi:hypothetical protein